MLSGPSIPTLTGCPFCSEPSVLLLLHVANKAGEIQQHHVRWTESATKVTYYMMQRRH